uniref:ATP synthase complex subunit 8 n=1 Tax=Copris tripartitus TaxID=438892 RepID=A0A6C0NA38_COPTR|nr:ATP synthase F0 subunit 8 [Copris tripartitus]QHW07551.1 ATP synthase F0 subunit 8 [Copris tripartitus]
MPQMAPLSWLSLFIMFCLTFMIFNSLNFYSFNYPIKIKFIKKMSSKINWKW